MNSMYEKQNEPQLLRCIAAQRKEYDKAKRRGFCKDLLTATFACFSIIASCVDNDLMTAIVLLFAVVTSLASKYIDMHTYKHKNIAAMTQQYVDVTLYNFVLQDKISTWGILPTSSELAETLSIVTDKDMQKVKNWYSDYSGLTPIKQVFCCQKENLRWDIELRREFKWFLMTIIGIAMIVLTVAALAINPSLIKLLCVISWMLPLIDFFYSYWSELQKDIERLQKLKDNCSEIEQSISKKDLVNLQKGILEHREKSTLIPNWFYKISKKIHQAREDKIANEMRSISSGSDKNES